eukprot:IDg2738t1
MDTDQMLVDGNFESLGRRDVRAVLKVEQYASHRRSRALFRASMRAYRTEYVHATISGVDE